jgi:arabinogalactan endo-1,4-beta-galactosidase
MKVKKWAARLILFCFTACSKHSSPAAVHTVVPPDSVPKTTTDTSFFAYGADVGWLTQMESAGYKFYNNNGVQQDCMQILKDKGINSIRLRVWVNPADGWNGQADVVAKAVRAKNLGLSVMIDFHYSDTWADPGHQTKPAAWANDGIAQLDSDVYRHTSTVLTALRSAGVTPLWVQVGNETDNGMLWNDGMATASMGNFASLISSGYNAVKAVFSTAKVIVHISGGFDNSRFRFIFDGLRTNGAKYDVIGMSLYPDYPGGGNWSALDSECLANMQDMTTRYGKQIMISEVGMDVNAPATGKSFLADIIAKSKSVKGLGVFYWEPESYNNWQGWPGAAFDSTGRPTVAMDAFSH